MRLLETHVDDSFLTVMRQIALNDLYRIVAFSRRDGLAFNYVAVPDDFKMKATEPFDPEEMARLFDIGQAMALSVEAWQSSSPGLHDADWQYG